MGAQLLTDLEMSPAAQAGRPAADRTVVLVPRRPFDQASWSRHLERLCHSHGQAVVFLGLADSPQEEAELRRQIDEVVRDLDGRIRPQVRIVRGSGWSAAIDAVRREGDVVVFPYLDGTEAHPAATARTQTGAAIAHWPTVGRRVVQLLGQVLDWAAPLLIIAGFFFVQVRIEQGLIGAWREVLLILSVFVEIATLWRWEQWSSGRLRS